MAGRIKTSGALLVRSGIENVGPFDLHIMVTSFDSRPQTATIEINVLSMTAPHKTRVGGTPRSLSVPTGGFQEFAVPALPAGFYEVTAALSEEVLKVSLAVNDSEGDVVLWLSPVQFEDLPVPRALAGSTQLGLARPRARPRRE